MNFDGVIIGAGAFLAIGMFHVLVVKAEYHFGVKTWPAFCLLGIGCIAASLFLANVIAAALLCIIGFSSLWSIMELFKQRERVKKGWFPAKPEKK